METREQLRVPVQYMYTSKQVYTKPYFYFYSLFMGSIKDILHRPKQLLLIATSKLNNKTSFDTSFSAWVLY